MQSTHTNPARIFIAIFSLVAILSLARPASAADLAILRNGFSISHDHHVVMGTTTRLYLSADDSSFTDVATEDITGFEKDLSPPPPPPASITLPASTSAASTSPIRTAADLTQVVNSASAAYHLDPDLVNSVIHAESGFNSHAVSPKGARGLMQLMPSTANTLGVNDAFDPQENVGGGSRYLRELLERYNFDLVKALAAYNAGPQRVEQYNGVPPFHETRAYVAKIVHDYNRKKIAQEKAAAALEKRNKAVAASSSKPHAPSTPVAQRRPAKTSLNLTPQIAASATAGNSTR